MVQEGRTPGWLGAPQQRPTCGQRRREASTVPRVPEFGGSGV